MENLRDADIETHLKKINSEFKDGFELLKKYPKSVTVFGGSAIGKDHPIFEKVIAVTGAIVKDLGYAVITGGGPGIMEAANKGAFEAGGNSIGLNVSIPHERYTNPYVNHSLKFSYFFSRKAMLMFAAEVYVFFPGGYGTLDELFNVLTLIQTEKIPRVPVVLFDSNYWNPFKAFLNDTLANGYKTIEAKDISLFEITDSPEKVLEIIKKSPISEWWRNIN